MSESQPCSPPHIIRFAADARPEVFGGARRAGRGHRVFESHPLRAPRSDIKLCPLPPLGVVGTPGREGLRGVHLWLPLPDLYPLCQTDIYIGWHGCVPLPRWQLHANIPMEEGWGIAGDRGEDAQPPRHLTVPSELVTCSYRRCVHFLESHWGIDPIQWLAGTRDTVRMQTTGHLTHLPPTAQTPQAFLLLPDPTLLSTAGPWMRQTSSGRRLTELRAAKTHETDLAAG